MAKLKILVIHGYIQSARTVRDNTVALRMLLESRGCELVYVDGPAYGNSSSRPWWILGRNLEIDNSSDRWQQCVEWWADHLSNNKYDGILGLSQGAAMAALLIAMISTPSAFKPAVIAHQPLKFAILCSGFVSHLPPHVDLYKALPKDLLTLHTVDNRDGIVPYDRTLELKEKFNKDKSTLIEHKEGHRVPVQSGMPERISDFIRNAVCPPNTCGKHSACY